MTRTILAVVSAMAGFAGQAEVISVTVGLDVNSPYGISEPWITIREGLLRLDYVESVASLPDRKAATGELRMKNGGVPDVDSLGAAIRALGAGARLRGVEAIVVGDVIKEGDDLVLKVSPTDETLRLAPLTTPVQRGMDVSEPERNAFAALTARSRGEGFRVRVTGPLRPRTTPRTPQTLEVRIFDPSGSTQKQTKL